MSENPTHYEWNGELYCENSYKLFTWEDEDSLTPPDKCPHCEVEL